MRRALILSALALLVWATLGSGGPVEGPQVGTNRVIEPYGHETFTVSFKAGEPAVVIASGNQQTYLGLYVYDADGNCVAWDDLAEKNTRDDLAVRWYPDRTGPYMVEVRNFGALHNIFQIAFR